MTASTRRWLGIPDRAKRRSASVVVSVLDTSVACRDLGKSHRARPISIRAASGAATTSSTTTVPARRERARHARREHDAEQTNDRLGLAGIAYGATMIPVRMLDSAGKGFTSPDREGIRMPPATAPTSSTCRSSTIRPGCDRTSRRSSTRLRYARRKGVLIVGASGNAASSASPTRRARTMCSRSAP